MALHTKSGCDGCPMTVQLEQMGLKVDNFDRIIALAGNPNTGKSTLFNTLTGLISTPETGQEKQLPVLRAAMFFKM